MLYSAHRTILMLVASMVVLLPVPALAEVSDKEPAASLFWAVGVPAALLCLVSARVRPWLGVIVFAPAAIWFATLFLELHSADVGRFLRIEQGNIYYLQAYAAFGAVVGGLVLGFRWHKRSRG